METSEDRAVTFLRQWGFDILARNYKFFAVEIDVLARRYINNETHYCFVEVKKVQRKNYFAGYNVLSYRQYNRYQNALKRWQITYKPLTRVSMGLLILDENEKLLDFIENV